MRRICPILRAILRLCSNGNPGGACGSNGSDNLPGGEMKEVIMTRARKYCRATPRPIRVAARLRVPLRLLSRKTSMPRTATVKKLRPSPEFPLDTHPEVSLDFGRVKQYLAKHALQEAGPARGPGHRARQDTPLPRRAAARAPAFRGQGQSRPARPQGPDPGGRRLRDRLDRRARHPARAWACRRPRSSTPTR